MKNTLGLSISNARRSIGGISVSIAGTTAGIAIIGDHASITMSVNEGTITARKWGSTYGGSEYGTGTSPTDYTAGDGGSLYATATVDGQDYTAAALIQYAPPSSVSTVPNQNYITGSGSQTLDITSYFSGSSLTYSIEGFSQASIDPATGIITTDTNDASFAAEFSAEFN